MWVARSIALVLLVASCDLPTQPPIASPSPSTAAAPCRLPVWWGEATGLGVHGAFVTVPGGAVTDAGTIPQPPQLTPTLLSSYYRGATYLAKTGTWVGVSGTVLSPGGDRMVYPTYTGPPDTYEVHLLTLATGAERVLQRGADQYIPIAFEAGWIYLVRPVANKGDVPENLYRLNPAGGTPELIKGNHRHAFPWAWAVIADGAAWGFEMRGEDTSHHYAILRLDLATHAVTEWFDGPADMDLSIQGVDTRHRLYVASLDHLNRIDLPTQVSELLDDPPVAVVGGYAPPPVLASDARGAWIGTSGGVRLYPLDAAPTTYAVGPPPESGAIVLPAGPCA